MILDENDYLTFQLYTASKTPRVRRARLRSWIFTTVTFAALAYLFYSSGNDMLGVYFLIITGISLALFPLYTRWRYKLHYRRYVRDMYKNRFGENCDLVFGRDTIIAKDTNVEMKINKSEIEEINEINDFYFLKMRTGTSLIISKRKTTDLENVKNEIKSLVETWGVKHNLELDWKWR